MTAHSVAELRDAWRAVEAGQFARAVRPATASPADGVSAWTPSHGERVVAVLGCAGGVGVSTLALALATATGAPARVVECCLPVASGFSAAANAELGEDGPWRRGSRGAALLERRATADPVVPAPASSVVEWTFLDAGATALTQPGPTWLASLLRTSVDIVLVTNATVPGLHHLESHAEFVRRDALGVVVGPRRWPRPVQVVAASLPNSFRLVPFPLDPRLAVTGLTPDPLPAPLLTAAQNVLALLGKEPS